MIRNTIYTLMALFVLSLSLSAQRATKDRNKYPTKEQIQEQKRSFLAQELQLSDKEVDGLMEVLKELDEHRFKLWQSVHDLRERILNGETLSDSEYSHFFDQVMNNRVREAELERTYYGKCRGIIPLSKLVKLERANREFAKYFFRKKD